MLRDHLLTVGCGFSDVTTKLRRLELKPKNLLVGKQFYQVLQTQHIDSFSQTEKV